MSQVAVIGAAAQIGGFVLAGARVCTAESGEDVRAAWDSLPATVDLVILTSEAAQALDPERTGPLGTGPGRLMVVTPG